MSDSTLRRVGTLVRSMPSSHGVDNPGALDEENGLWQHTVGADIAAHTHALLDAGELLVFADSPVWGHTVNRQKNSIRTHLRANGVSVDNITVKIRPKGPDRFPTPPQRKPEPIGSASVKALEQCACSVSTPGLRKALQRLSRCSAVEDTHDS